MGKASNGNSTTAAPAASASEVVKSSWMTKRSQLKSRFSFTNYREGGEEAVDLGYFRLVNRTRSRVGEEDTFEIYLRYRVTSPV